MRTFLTLFALLLPLVGKGGDQATAIATVFGGFLAGVSITSPGSGYSVTPSVRLRGGNGQGALVAAFIENGTVIRIVVTSAGSGYTSAPVVEVDPPIPSESEAQPTVDIDLVPRLNLTGTKGSLHLIEWSEKLGGDAVWFRLTNIVLTTTQTQFLDLSIPLKGHRYYRRRDLSKPPITLPEGFVWIPTGTFLMGSPTTEASRSSGEKQHKVLLTQGFGMLQHEVTQAEYLSVVGFNPSAFRNGVSSLDTGTGGIVTNQMQHPVEHVSWIDAVNYSILLTQREKVAGRIPKNYEFRLPTEAEWEYACRGGTTNAFYFGNSIHQGMANFQVRFEYDALFSEIARPENVWIGRTLEVASYAPNAFGLYDMCGNVWEWCSDWYADYSAGEFTDPIGPDSGSVRVIRGGSWVHNGVWCRSAARLVVEPAYRGNNVGFRVVLALIKNP